MGEEEDGGKIFAQFTSPAGEASGPQIEVPLGLTSKQLNGVINELLGNDTGRRSSACIWDVRGVAKKA